MRKLNPNAIEYTYKPTQHMIIFSSLWLHKILRLWMRFQILDEDKKGYLIRADFMKINTLSSNPLVFRIINVFFNRDKSNTEIGRLHQSYISITD